MTEKTLDHILAECLEEMEQTGDIRTALRDYPEHAIELQALLELAQYAQRSYEDVPEPPGGLAVGRARLLSEARQDSADNRVFPLIFMIFPTIRDDARYREGVAHLQAGEWQEGMACFQELLQEHPESQDFAQTLDGAPFEGGWETAVRVEPEPREGRWRPFVYGGLIAIIIVSVGLHVLRYVREGALPGVPSAQLTQSELQRTEWLVEGQDYLAAGQLDAAQSRFAAVLNQAPGNREALEGLEQIAVQRLVRDLYQQAVALQDAGDDEQALKQFREVSRRSPGYRDVAGRIAAIEQGRDLDALLAEAEAAYQAGRAAEAIAAYEQIEEADAGYRRDLIDDRLFELHMELGREIVTTEPPTDGDPPGVQVLPQAIQHFSQAENRRPSSADAAVERELAIECAEGLRAYGEGRWDTATARLKAVLQERPEYLGGSVVETLYRAYIRSAERHEEAGDVQLAYQDYQSALKLPVDTTLARDRAANLAPRLTPTPTPTATPAPADS